jgi:hypothetical protein
MTKMSLETLGKVLIIGGIVIAGLGGGVWLMGRLGLTLGRLPGDILVERPGFSVYVPLATTVLLSLGLTLIVNLVLWLMRK